MVQGVIKEILTQKENDWGRYKIQIKDRGIIAVGIIPSAAVGMDVILEGKEVDNQYGHQFKIKSVLSTAVDDCAGARRFLTEGYLKGIGPAKAQELLDSYGKNVVFLFDTEEGRQKLCMVKGITKKLLDNVMPYYEENKKYLPILLFLNGTGTKKQVEKIYKEYGNRTMHILKTNPYRLQMDLDGFGFKKVDELAMKSGQVKKTSIYRVMAAVKYSVENASVGKGHCYLPIVELEEQVTKLLVPMPKIENITEKVIENAVNDWEANRKRFIKGYKPTEEQLKLIEEMVAERKEMQSVFKEAIEQATKENMLVEEDCNIYTSLMYNTERTAAKLIARMCKQPSVRQIDEETLSRAVKEVEQRKTDELRDKGINTEFVTTDEQLKAVKIGTSNRIAIVSGGPGRGKTAISEEIAHAFLCSGKVYDKSDIVMLAPTGRAAQRIKESTGYDAMTAQRAVLGLERNEIPNGKLILCDETSMVDIYLLVKILKFAQNCNLLFVGDVNQIASVGPGKVLADMIESGEIPYIILQKGHRNTGTIAMNSELINAGKKISTYQYDEHFVYTPASKDNIADCLVEDYKKKVKEYGIENVMLCTAMRERGIVSVNKLNLRLQEELTKGQPEARFGNHVFRVGDRVMQNANDYEFLIRRPTGICAGIFNGEKGTIAKISWNEEEQAHRIVVLFDDGSVGGYTKNNIDYLEIAYATTLHKCQGSEASCMMMAYTFADYMLLNRALFYTGETRAKKEFRFYGEEKYQYGKNISVFDIAVKKAEDARRYTGLTTKIQEAYNVIK